MPEPYYTDSAVTLYHGDCLDVLAQLPDASVDAVCTDPPYGISFMGKEWDGAAIRAAAQRDREARKSLGPESATRPGRAQPRSKSAYGNEAIIAGPVRGGRDFQDWCEQWATECLRILKPGGHLLSFGGSRTWHRLAAAVEDAGFEIRDSIAWLYSSGFPKSLDVSKAIDKAGGESPARQAQLLREARLRAGLSPERVAELIGCTATSIRNWEDGRSRAAGLPVEHITPSIKYRSALAELLGYSPDERRIVGLTDDRRDDGTVIGLGHSGTVYGEATTDLAKQWQGWGTALKPAFEPIVVGRKPLAGTVAANVAEHGTGALNIDACRIATTDKLHGTGQPPLTHGGLNPRPFHASHEPQRSQQHDAGRWPTNVVLDGEMADELDRQSGVLRSGTMRAGTERQPRAGGTIYGADDRSFVPADTYGDEGGASRFFPVFRYEAKAPSSERPSVNGIAHPTVKPLDLMRWLVRLVTPPGGIVLDPFAGSGTTAEACIHEHMRCITIEREADYLPLIVARLSKPMAVGFDFGSADA